MYSTSEHSSKSSYIFLFFLDCTTIQCRPSLPYAEQQLILWIIGFPTYLTRGTGWCSWLRQCATELEGREFDSWWCQWNFSLTQLSGCTMVLWSTQPLTEKNTRNIAWGKEKTVHKITFTSQMSWNLEASTSQAPQCLFRPEQGLLYLLQIWTQRGKRCRCICE